MNQDTKYDLTEEEYKKCLARAEAAVFMKGRPVRNPRSIFVVAQAGARKKWSKKFCNK